MGGGDEGFGELTSVNWRTRERIFLSEWIRMICVKQSELDYSLRNTASGYTTVPLLCGNWKKLPAGFLSYRRLPFSFHFIYPGLLIRKMEGNLKFNFVLSESPRNGHHENVNHWRFFFFPHGV